VKTQDLNLQEVQQNDTEKHELLRLENINKSFGTVEVLRGINLSVSKGEFITILGASGCGKTTLLRVIAGLEETDAGLVFFNGLDVSAVEPHKRNVRMVFQNYALFPHMNVANNIAYSLRLMHTGKNEIKKAVSEVLELVRLSGYEKRMPSELSGGQKQRVAVARALVNHPPMLLLDEPLGALDLQLRRQMQIELKRIQEQLGITFIYITHDQEEALTMSDRIAVMRNGLFEQIGNARDIYSRPATSYVARFVGNANVLKGRDGCIAIRSEHVEFLPFEESPSGETPASPGLLKSHYAPRTPLILHRTGELASLPISPDEGRLYFSSSVETAEYNAEKTRVLSATGNLAEAAANLFDMLHELDSLGLKLIRAEEAPSTGLGLAINDRLKRAAH
jgi:ABC-type Fe3+/spermidine/putrescine transport system ATPase subunit